MKNQNKKGFTIVELVIVIAVVAILAAVLIPTFANLVKKANQSSDIQATRQMNTALAVAGELADIDAVIDALAEAGFNSKKALIPVTTGYTFYWYAGAKQIVLENEKGEVVFPEGIAKETGISLEASVKYINISANTVADIVNAIANGSEDIKLEADITIDRDINVEAGNVTLNLNGHTFNSVQNSGNGRSSVIYIREGASLTVENGTFNVRSLQNYGNLTIKEDTTINAMDTNGGGCIKNKTGNVVIEGGTFNVLNYVKWDEDTLGGAVAVENNGGTVTIKGGTFNTNTEAYLITNLSGAMTIEGGNFTSIRGVVACEGGELNITGGTFTATTDKPEAQSGHVVYAENGQVKITGGEFVQNSTDAGEYVFCVPDYAKGGTTITVAASVAGNTEELVLSKNQSYK